ncbi:MAG: hypothetical protein V5B44_00120 [Candidatus Accumulibacter necessarius]
MPRTEHHHTLTSAGLAHIVEEEKSFGGALGRPSGARFKTFERLKRYREASATSAICSLPTTTFGASTGRWKKSIAIRFTNRHRHAEPPTQGRHQTITSSLN